MTLRRGETPAHGIAVFPFLKTSESIRLGSFTFRSTDDTTDLSEEDSSHVREIAGMLFLLDDLRIRSAAYAMLPSLNLDKPEPCLRELEHIQAIVAYCYGAPSHWRMTSAGISLRHLSTICFRNYSGSLRAIPRRGC
jgi:hypothetical protein